MTGTGRAMVSTPAMAHKDPTIFPHTPTGLQKIVMNALYFYFGLGITCLVFSWSWIFFSERKKVKSGQIWDNKVAMFLSYFVILRPQFGFYCMSRVNSRKRYFATLSAFEALWKMFKNKIKSFFLHLKLTIKNKGGPVNSTLFATIFCII